MFVGGEHHVEQVRSHACVAACVGIVLRARGQAFDEAALMAGRDTGFPESEAARLLGGVHDPVATDEQLLATLDLLGAGDICLVVRVCAPVYVRLLGDRPGGRPSRHGALAAPGYFGAPHAIVVFDADAEGVDYLDPYYPREGQPLRMSRARLLEMFQGDVVTVPLVRAAVAPIP